MLGIAGEAIPLSGSGGFPRGAGSAPAGRIYLFSGFAGGDGLPRRRRDGGSSTHVADRLVDAGLHAVLVGRGAGDRDADAVDAAVRVVGDELGFVDADRVGVDLFDRDAEVGGVLVGLVVGDGGDLHRVERVDRGGAGVDGREVFDALHGRDHVLAVLIIATLRAHVDPSRDFLAGHVAGDHAGERGFVRAVAHAIELDFVDEGEAHLDQVFAVADLADGFAIIFAVEADDFTHANGVVVVEHLGGGLRELGRVVDVAVLDAVDFGLGGFVGGVHGGVLVGLVGELEVQGVVDVLRIGTFGARHQDELELVRQEGGLLAQVLITQGHAAGNELFVVRAVPVLERAESLQGDQERFALAVAAVFRHLGHGEEFGFEVDDELFVHGDLVDAVLLVEVGFLEVDPVGQHLHDLGRAGVFRRVLGRVAGGLAGRGFRGFRRDDVADEGGDAEGDEYEILARVFHVNLLAL